MSTERRWPHPEITADLLALRARNPLVHCLTNVVASPLTANVLLAIGASPAMVNAEQEAAGFAAIANAVLINVGTLTESSARAMQAAAETAAAAGVPWVLDPVAVGALAWRRRFVRGLLAHRPAVIRGNGSEILTLAGAAGSGKGVDSTASSADALAAAAALASASKAVVALSGATDYITDGATVIEVPGGDAMLTRVTGTGCALGAVIAGFLGAGAPPLRAATAASAIVAAAAETAAVYSHGPGSFAVAWLDALAGLGP
jgi:hydroxyethylthiazole kinase